MDNIFRGEILKEVKYIPDTNQYVVNGNIIKLEGLTETEKLTLEGFQCQNWQLLKSQTNNNGNLLC
jgi:hypothetical protein